jgi:hypothetical protein
MTTASAAFAVIKSRLTAGGLDFPLRYQGEDGGPLPDTPSPFAYVEFQPERGAIASFGGGRGANRYRHPARIDAYVFVPNGHGLKEATDRAELIAALFRSYRDADISCFEATVFAGGHGSEISVPGLASAVNDYWYAAVDVSLHFDLIG